MTPLSQSVVPKQGSPHSPPQALLSPASLSPTSLPGSPHQGSPHHLEHPKRHPSSPQHQQSHQNHLESPKRHQGSHPGLRNIENLVNGISNGVKEGSKFEQVRHLEPAPARTLNTWEKQFLFSKVKCKIPVCDNGKLLSDNNNNRRQFPVPVLPLLLFLCTRQYFYSILFKAWNIWSHQE